jgi:fluoride exporter
MIWVAVALAGGLGSACRFAVDHAIRTRLGSQLPWGTLVVNVTGSFVAGIVVRLAAEAVVSDELRLVVAGGFLGAYTTFSTAMVETALLLERRAPARALLNLLGPVLLATLAALAGWWLAA